MENEQENIFRQIQEAMNNLPENFSILEEQIDIDLQMKYFNYAKELKKEFSKEYILAKKDDLFDDEMDIEEKKNLMVLLASVNEVEAYRTLEKYVTNPNPGLKDWAILALQESRMLMQSTLLDEQQVFISTGLGGQGQKLRYFVIIRLNDTNLLFNETQQKLVESELKFTIEKYDGIFESTEFEEGFAKCLMLMPLKVDLQEMFHSFIDECNQYGNFLNEDVIITNVRTLSIEEIKDFLNKEQHKENDE